MLTSIKTLVFFIGYFAFIANTGSETLRTPDDAFAGLVDYPFAPHYMEVDGLRIHYIDEGSYNEKTIFLLHGQPSWSYLYRHMIPVLVDAGYRVIAPDLMGFGKSDKPTGLTAHSYQAHVDWMTIFVRQLGIKNAAAFMQDWGGMIGLRVLAQEPEWLARLVVSNTILPDASGAGRFLLPLGLKSMAFFAGKSTIDDLAAKQSFGNWSNYFHYTETLEIGRVLQILTTRSLTAAEMAAYDAPFPDPRFYAGPRRMPQIIASQLSENHRAWVDVLEHWDKPVLTLFSDKDPFLGESGIDKQFQTRMPGAAGQPHSIIVDASHFLQEDQSTEIANRIIHWLTDSHF